jgi:phosphoenolpyruvate carboxylase
MAFASGDGSASPKELSAFSTLAHDALASVLSSQLGADNYARIEAIRAATRAFRGGGGGGDPAAAAAELARLTDVDLPLQLNIIRAFSYFSHLLNIAEDAEVKQREAQLAEAECAPGSLLHAVRALAASGVGGGRVREWLREACVSPVLTAHPTEVQRRSILECEGGIGRLLLEHARAQSPREARDAQTALQRLVLQLWQTAMLRLTKLKVADEVNNALIFYQRTFLTCVPRLYADLDALLAEHLPREEKKEGGGGGGGGEGSEGAPPCFLQIGSWVGGDRDGNPCALNN